MNLLFAMAHPYLPEFSGGVQSSTHELALELAGRGLNVSVLAHLIGSGYVGRRARIVMKLLRRPAAADQGLGYPVYRTWVAWDAVEYVARIARPDVVIIQPRFPVRVALEFMKLRIPVVLYLRDVEFRDLGGSIKELHGAHFVANSQFTADRYADAFGIKATVINPLFLPERYRTETRRRNVTFVNPHPLKGAELAIQIAQGCPDIPFRFVESWALEPQQRAALQQRLRSIPNVELQPRTDDMKRVYGDARIMLMPSKWEEAWGRIASEAHFSGIPVVASRSGGLPESVGPGGVLVDPGAPAELWIEIINRLWSEPNYYRELSEAASGYASRPALNRDHQINALIGVLDEAISERR
jgi:glycosyltransferase involved in cell wall biosynthesis